MSAETMPGLPAADGPLGLWPLAVEVTPVVFGLCGDHESTGWYYKVDAEHTLWKGPWWELNVSPVTSLTYDDLLTEFIAKTGAVELFNLDFDPDESPMLRQRMRFFRIRHWNFWTRVVGVRIVEATSGLL